ncbi:hypothetical protein [Dyella sp.]|jgi:hypothetical protein|uniref:hypothetical protein n=1 Tax=Dyella sp. TaxID=1869338 RepID=UPI002D7A1EC9|nr:hypothetical protein [Dyella sp.]HET6430726.1 hypothetical protein [Dyella sp.]
MRLAHLIIALLFIVPVIALAQSTHAPSLRERMGQAQFQAAGLGKLSPEELARLESWLAAHPQTETRMVSATGKPVFYAASARRQAFEAHVDGHFAGWTGRNLITLDNGQQWRQRGSDQPACNSSDNALAKVKPSLFDSWLMYVKGCNGSVHVERVK